MLIQLFPQGYYGSLQKSKYSISVAFLMSYKLLSIVKEKEGCISFLGLLGKHLLSYNSRGQKGQHQGVGWIHSPPKGNPFFLLPASGGCKLGLWLHHPQLCLRLHVALSVHLSLKSPSTFLVEELPSLGLGPPEI